ncbi:hypothetical protein [Terrarubrum flagellatum]|uniref:hypothetical protein n=1 Tax=Terrirubrum flagellatum TaxID=2895980 RepID=UPI0031456692
MSFMRTLAIAALGAACLSGAALAQQGGGRDGGGNGGGGGAAGNADPTSMVSMLVVAQSANRQPPQRAPRPRGGNSDRFGCSAYAFEGITGDSIRECPRY